MADNGCIYQTWYKGKTLEIRGVASKLAAQEEAARQFKAKKSWEVAVELVGKVESGEEKPVVHTAVD